MLRAIRRLGHAAKWWTGLRGLCATAEEFQNVEELRGAVQDFAKRHVAPYAEQIDRENGFPSQVNLWKLMGDFGLHGAPLMPSDVEMRCR